eukprot:357586-Chlamydomonas_euryale.AAC.4
MSSSRLLTSAYETVRAGGVFCGSVIAIGGVMYLPVKILLGVESLLKQHEAMQKDIDAVRLEVAQGFNKLLRQKGAH